MWGGVLLIAVLFAGCATGSGANGEEEKRTPPPEVTDHTVDERPDSVRSVQPRVDVRLEVKDLVGIDREAYEGKLRRAIQRCYNRRVYAGEVTREGSMVYEMLVTRNGHVAGTEQVSSDLHDDALVRCVEQELGQVRFDLTSPDKPVYRVFVRLRFTLEPLSPSKSPV